MLRTVTVLMLLCWASAGVAQQQVSQKLIFPVFLKGVRIDMTLKAFARERDTTRMTARHTGFDSQYLEQINKDQVVDVRYLFDEERRLYEVIIRFAPDFNIHGYMAGMYGRPNKTKTHWQFKIGDTLELRVFEQDHSIHIANARDF